MSIVNLSTTSLTKPLDPPSKGKIRKTACTRRKGRREAGIWEEALSSLLGFYDSYYYSNYCYYYNYCCCYFDYSDYYDYYFDDYCYYYYYCDYYWSLRSRAA